LGLAGVIELDGNLVHTFLKLGALWILLISLSWLVTRPNTNIKAELHQTTRIF